MKTLLAVVGVLAIALFTLGCAGIPYEEGDHPWGRTEASERHDDPDVRKDDS